MRYFIDSTPGRDAVGDENLMLRATNNYIELIYTINESTYFIVNIIPRNNYSAFVTTCLGDCFDKVVDNLDDEDYVETLCDTWPIFVNLLQNGLKDKYSEGALIKLEDIDTGDHKWFIASIAGNLNFDSIEDLLCDQTKQAVDTVITKTVELYNELSTKSPSKTKAFLKGFLKGAAMVALFALGGDSTSA